MRFLKLLAVCFLICSCQERHDYKIIGDIKGIPDSTVIELYIDYGNLAERIASDTIIDGRFCFTDTIGDEISQMKLFMKDSRNFQGHCNLWVGKGNIEVSGKGRLLSTWRVKSNIQEQKDENRILHLTRLYRIKEDSLCNIRQQSNHNDNESIRRQIDSLNIIKSNIELSFLKDNYNSKVAVIYLSQLVQSGDSLQKAEIKEIYNKIDTLYQNTLWGECVKNYLNKAVPPVKGDKYPDFIAFDLGSKRHQLSDYQGRYILLDFWSCGCFPCLMSIPELREISEKHHNKIIIISLNIDTRKKVWVESSKRDSISWTNLSDGKSTYGGAGFLYGVDGTPTFVLINPEGIIVDRWMGYGHGSIMEKLSAYSLLD